MLAEGSSSRCLTELVFEVWDVGIVALLLCRGEFLRRMGLLVLPSETKTVWPFLSLKSDTPTIRSIPMADASPALS